MTLEDALRGLKNYWAVRPAGGTRAELLAIARSRGFEEPLLNVWLDVFLAGFAATRALGVTVATYEALADQVAVAGPTIAADAADAVFAYLVQPGSNLDKVRKRDQVVILNDAITRTSDRITAFDGAASLALAAIPGHAGLSDVTVAINRGRNGIVQVRAGLITKRDELRDEVA